MDKHLDNGYIHQGGHNEHNIHNDAFIHKNHIETHVPTITVHHYHHHTTNHHIEPIYSNNKYDDAFDGSYNHIESNVHHDYNSYDNLGTDHGIGFNKQIGHSGNSILSGTLGGNVGNILR